MNGTNSNQCIAWAGAQASVYSLRDILEIAVTVQAHETRRAALAVTEIVARLNVAAAELTANHGGMLVQISTGEVRGDNEQTTAARVWLARDNERRDGLALLGGVAADVMRGLGFKNARGLRRRTDAAKAASDRVARAARWEAIRSWQ